MACRMRERLGTGTTLTRNCQWILDPRSPTFDHTPKSLNHHHHNLHWILNIGAAFTNCFVIFHLTLNNEKGEYSNQRPRQFNSMHHDLKAPRLKLRGLCQICRGEAKAEIAEWRLESLRGDQEKHNNLCFVSFSTEISKRNRVQIWAIDFAKHHIDSFRKAVREHLLLFFVQNLDVHLLFTGTSEPFGISPSRNIKFISSSHRIKISPQKAVIEAWVIHTLDRDTCPFFFTNRKLKESESFAIANVSSCLDRLLVSYI